MKLACILITFFMIALSAEAAASKACLVLSRDIKPYNEASKGFRKSYDGQTLEFNLGGSAKNAYKNLGKIKNSNCDIFIAVGSLSLDFLKLRTSKKPILYMMSLNATPSKTNDRIITGVQLESSPEDTLKMITEVLPNTKRIGMIYTPDLTGWYIKKTISIAKKMNLKIIPISVNSISEFIHSLPALFSTSDAVCMVPDAITSSRFAFERMISTSFKRGVPLFGLSTKHTNKASIAALNTKHLKHGETLGIIANSLSHGTYSHTNSRQFVPQAGFTINLKTAKRLGFSIPDSATKKAVKTID